MRTQALNSPLLNRLVSCSRKRACTQTNWTMAASELNGAPHISRDLREESQARPGHGRAAQEQNIHWCLLSILNSVLYQGPQVVPRSRMPFGSCWISPR
jgi:hypothetical protein